MQSLFQTLAFCVQEAGVLVKGIEDQQGFVCVLLCQIIMVDLKWSIHHGWLLDWVTLEISTMELDTMLVLK